MNSRIRRALTLALALAAAGAQPASAQLGDITDVVTSPDCAVSDGGRLLVANGDQATFGGSASTDRADLGRQIYIDHGPATEFTFTTIQMTSLTCIEDGRHAQMTGTGRFDPKVGPDQIVGFRLEVQDSRDGRFADGYHLTLSNGYDTGLQPVLHGEVQVHFR